MRRLGIAAGVVAVALLLAWLRDPAWLRGVESGLGPWQSDAAGTRFRWTGGRASFFVDAAVREVRLPVRVPDLPTAWPTVLTVAVDGRTAARLQISDSDWRTVRVGMPARVGRLPRSLRRIDLHVDRTQPGNRGVQLGEIETVR